MLPPQIGHLRQSPRVKWGLVGVLLVVFLMVLPSRNSEPLPEPDADPGAESAATPERPAAAAPSGGPASPPTEVPPSTPRRWPDPTLEEVVAQDPFAVGDALGQTLYAAEYARQAEIAARARDEALARERQRADELGRELDAIRNQRVGAVVWNSRGAVALLGTQAIRVGDRVDGLQVVEISPDGVTVSLPAASDAVSGETRRSLPDK